MFDSIKSVQILHKLNRILEKIFTIGFNIRKTCSNFIRPRGGRNMEFEYDEYEDYEKKCNEIKMANAELLELFKVDLSNLSPKTRNNHLGNVEYYLNSFLLSYESLTFEYGIKKISDYLGNFFIRKCMWSTPETIRQTAASIKKFYKCMLDHGKIDKTDYNLLCNIIKDEMDQWQADCAQFNNIDEVNPFHFF